MKKNVFSRAMAVLASMAVLGAASMMTASAAGVSGGSVTAKAGDTNVSVPFNVVDIPGCAGAELTFTADAPLTVKGVSAAMSDAPVSGGIAAVFVNGNGWTGTTVSVDVAADAAPGTYEVRVAITDGADGIDDGNQGYVENPTLVAGTVVVEAETTEPEPTTTEPVTTVADTTAAPVTTAKPTTVKAATTSAPKTGTAGVAVAVAGLVTAGATAVVLKKKH